MLVLGVKLEREMEIYIASKYFQNMYYKRGESNFTEKSGKYPSESNV